MIDCVLGEGHFTIFPHTNRKIESEVSAEPSDLIALMEQELQELQEMILWYRLDVTVLMLQLLFIDLTNG